MSSNNLRKKATQEQKELITTFLSEHEGLRTRKFTAEMTYQKYQNLWSELTDKLNTLGPSKNVKDWQKYWNDQRSRVKRKAAFIKQSHQKTGGGIDESIEPLTAEDEQILQLMGGIVVSGDNTITEAGLPIVNDDSYFEYVIGLDDVIKEASSISSKEQPATCSFDEGINAVSGQDKTGQRHDLDLPKTPKNKKRKFSEMPSDKELLIQTQIESNDIQRQIADSLKKRNIIEEKKVEIKEKKLAALIEKNKLEEKKIDAINNLAQKLLNFIPSST